MPADRPAPASQVLREHELFMWSDEDTESKRASAQEFDAALAKIQEALERTDMALNWHDPRIVPTEEVPDQETAIRLARAALRAVEMWVDHRLCGRSGRELARQEGVTPNRIHQLVKQAEPADPPAPGEAIGMSTPDELAATVEEAIAAGGDFRNEPVGLAGAVALAELVAVARNAEQRAESLVQSYHNERALRLAAEAERDRLRDEAIHSFQMYGDPEDIVRERDRLADALRKISAVRLPTGNAVGRDELHGCHKARIEMQNIARAALSDLPAEQAPEETQ